MYLQERIIGTPGSVVFASDGSRALVLGCSRQLIGDPKLGSTGFRYCGSILASDRRPIFARQRELLERAAELADCITREFGLRGLNGIDFIARDGVPYPTEVNPRYSASMELVERAGGPSIFETHAGSFRGELPSALRPARKLHGKAIVFARRDVRMPATDHWLGNRWFADVPHRGELISRGRPICTVFAEALRANTCRRFLLRRAAAVYRAVEAETVRAA
jgi:predicted ATP-grasp superfamily ATP-dependent carboligase